MVSGYCTYLCENGWSLRKGQCTSHDRRAMVLVTHFVLDLVNQMSVQRCESTEFESILGVTMLGPGHGSTTSHVATGSGEGGHLCPEL